jgi:hypothetical protein
MDSSSPSLTIQGGTLKLHLPCPAGKRPGGGLRSKVTEFSAQSRRRLMATFAALNWALYAELGTPILFLTLTVPEELWGDLVRVRGGLTRFRDWLKHQPGYEAAIVRRELGESRGMLHYHLIVFGCHFLPASELRTVWGRSLRLDGPARVGVELAKNPQHVSRYLSKYLSKVGGFVGEGSGQAAGRRADASLSPPDPVTLSKSHNVEASSGGRSGSRWWYVWGELNEGERVDVGGLDARRLAVRVRRVFRRWVMSKARGRVEHAVRGQFDAYGRLYSSRELDAEVSRRFGRMRGRGRFRWLFGSGGFLLMAGPDVLWQCYCACIDGAGAVVLVEGELTDEQ